ncbi:DUF2528 family protein [uncultured Stenotrophomonas sp.]|uniref:DUF2528 family protein n=1 Tax=uncultured Stenotrophomonas sp. TaxID=165438 RepID=UPI0025DA13C3|nr:DUF2528 family protein [uncultured Stenotrophomonas sp.]
MTIKRYNIERNWGEGQVQLEIDHNILTPEQAAEINEFWTGADERLDAADDNPVLAVIKIAGAEFMGWVLDANSSYSTESMQREFDQLEGWPSPHGIRLVGWDDRPDLDSSLMQVEEIEVPHG